MNVSEYTGRIHAVESRVIGEGLQRPIKVFIASSNKLKINAAYEAIQGKTLNGLAMELYDTDWFYYTPESGVNNQPYGVGETMQGAINRCFACPKLVIKSSYFCVVAIESGIVFNNNTEKYEEIVCVCINCNGAIYTYTGNEYAIEIPEKYYGLMTKVRNSNFQSTLGELIDKEIGCKPNEWHGIVTDGKMTRQNQINLTIDALINKSFFL